jgi:hypothetical protein
MSGRPSRRHEPQQAAPRPVAASRGRDERRPIDTDPLTLLALWLADVAAESRLTQHEASDTVEGTRRAAP